MLTHDFLLAVDADAFAAACGLVELDDWQVKVLEGTASKVLLNCHRQAGKSTVAALAAVRELVFNPGALVLLVSPSLRQSGELFRKVIGYFNALPHRPEVALESASRLQLRNGSRAISLPGTEKTLRGFSKASLIVLDEASRIEDGLIAGLRPMMALSVGARMLVMSTPFGRRGYFFERWTSGEDWQRIEVRAEQCPRITPEYLEEEKRELGPLLYSQEYECKFVDSEQQLFASAIIEAAFDDGIEPLFCAA